ncbi:MAG: hypothetical protein ACTSO9_09275 [Candidatus Helarchaeota archaeon]
MYDWITYMVFTLAIILTIIATIYLVWFLVHITAGTRYSRKKSFIAVPIIGLLYGFGIHFFLLWMGVGL